MRGLKLALRAGLVLTGLVILAVVAINLYVVRSAGELADRPQLCAAHEVALVLGASPWSPDGSPSPHFAGRMATAADLYRLGRVRHLLLSGANPEPYYNEPLRMQRALAERGVPAAAVTLDYAGRRTLDSVVRAREIFGLDDALIVSQRYHLYRALFLARSLGLAADACVAPEPPLASRARTELREVGARVLAVLDVYLLGTGPELLGPPEPIVLTPESSL